MSGQSNDFKKCTVRITLRLRKNQLAEKVKVTESSYSSISEEPNISMGSSDYEDDIPVINDAEAICMARNALRHYSNKFKLNFHSVNNYESEKGRSPSKTSNSNQSSTSESNVSSHNYSSSLGTTVRTCPISSMDSFHAHERDFDEYKQDHSDSPGKGKHEKEASE